MAESFERPLSCFGFKYANPIQHSCFFDSLISVKLFRIAEIRRKFSEFDEDGSGSVSATEAHQILQKELAFTPAQSAELVARYDKNNDGQLSFEEFVAFYSKVKAKYVAQVNTINSLVNDRWSRYFEYEVQFYFEVTDFCGFW